MNKTTITVTDEYNTATIVCEDYTWAQLCSKFADCLNQMEYQIDKEIFDAHMKTLSKAHFDSVIAKTQPKNLTQWMAKFEKWAEDRDLYNNSSYDVQDLKFRSEYGECCDNMAKGRCIKDDIGDMMCVITHLLKFADMPIRGDITPEVYKSNSIAACVLIEYLNYGKLYDVIGVLKGMAKNAGLTIEECCEHAFNDIKDRKGKFVNGTFVKESDFNE